MVYRRPGISCSSLPLFFPSFVFEMNFGMSISAQGSSFGNQICSPARCPQPIVLGKNIQDHLSCVDTLRFFALPSLQVALLVPYELRSRGTAARAWRERWKKWGEHGAVKLLVASDEIESPSVSCREDDGYQRLLALLLAEVRRRPERSTAVSPDLWAFRKHFVHLRYVANRLYWEHEPYFESCVCDRQKTSGAGILLDFLACDHWVALITTLPSSRGGFSMSHQAFYLFRRHLCQHIIVVSRCRFMPPIKPGTERLL